MAPQNNNLFIIAGELSGDLHGAHLLEKLHGSSSNWHIEGVGGPLMRVADMDLFLPMEDFQVMGFGEIIRSLPKLWRQFKQVRDRILEKNPKAVVLIDYPGFNLRLARSLKKKGYQGKIVQLISPTVWAWGKKRIPLMTKYLDLLLTIYPFEKDYFEGTGLAVKYIGNPLIETVSKYPYDDDWRKRTGISNSEQLVGLFPGSRNSELRDNLDNMIDCAMQLKLKCPEVRFAVSCSHNRHLPFIESTLKKRGESFTASAVIVPPQYTYELMRDCTTAIAVSGTVTLELALHHKPTLVLYTATAFNRFIIERILRVKLPHFCIVNILSKKETFPELIRTPFTLEKGSDHLLNLHLNEKMRSECVATCREISLQLHCGSSSEQALKAIEEVILG